MGKNTKIGAMVINYLATCGKTRVGTVELLKAVAPGCLRMNKLDKAFSMIEPVLVSLASEGLVRLSAEVDPSTGMVPLVIHILPRMKKPAERLMQPGNAPGKESGERKEQSGTGEKPVPEARRGKAGREDAVRVRYEAFEALFERKKKVVRLRGEWCRFVSAMIYQDIEEQVSFQACVIAFINGMIWQKRQEQQGQVKPHMEEEDKPEPEMQPALLSQIDEIVRADEEKNGILKAARRKSRGAQDADAPLLRLSQEEIRDYMRSLHRTREEIQPGNLWRDAMSMFLGGLLQQLPVYEACMEAFKAGIIWQMHRNKLESQD
jgi:hypothetical protein